MSLTSAPDLMSSSCGEVKGWCAAFQVLVSSFHSYMGKSVTQRNLKSAAVPVCSKSLCLSANFLREVEAERADALVDPLRIVVPLRGRAELGRDDDGEVVGVASCRASGCDRCVGERGEGFVGLQARDVEEVEAAVAEACADFARASVLRCGAAEAAGLGDDEAEDGQLLLDLQVLAQLGREVIGEVDHRGQAHVGLVDAVLADGLVVGHLDEGRGERDAGGREGGA